MYNMDFTRHDLGIKTGENKVHLCSAFIVLDAAETVLFNVRQLMNYVFLLCTESKMRIMNSFSSRMSVVAMGILST